MTAPPPEPLNGPLNGPLAGLVIADFSRVLAGPYATMLLGDLGATVIKIERLEGGDDTRAWGPPWADGQSTYFQSVNRNKTSVTCDLRRPDDLAAARSLCARADVVIENFRAGTMDRLGLGWDAVHTLNPRAVYCSITGFGAGAGADLPGYDMLIQAVGGLMSINGEPGGPPVKVGVAVVDVITGLHALTGILAALRHRDACGEGQLVEVNLLTSLLSGLVNQVSGYLGAGVVPGPLGNRHPSIAPYELVRAADRPLALAVGNDKQFTALCGALDLPLLATDERFATNAARVAHRDELIAALEAVFMTLDAEAWVPRLTAVGVPCGPVNTIDHAIAYAESLGLNPTVQVSRAAEAGVTSQPQLRHPIDFSATPADYRSAPPDWATVRPLREVLGELLG